MNNYLLFFEVMLEYKMVNPVYKYVLELIDEQIEDNKNKDDFLVLFAIYFSFLSDGNVCMSLDINDLSMKWEKKANSTKISLQENADFDENKFEEMKDRAYSAINNSLKLINETNLPELIGENKIFVIDDNWLYLMKYEISRLSIIKSIKSLYAFSSNEPVAFSYKKCVNDGFSLSIGQEKAITDGINKNLIITGGPGTGKTTSILFLLLNLLSKKDDYDIYLVAPSGKASSRMKESIINGLKNLNNDYKNNNEKVISIINNLQESTIHRLLSFDPETKGFLYNKEHKFSKNSLFVIDEASMIDICLFDSLLSAIPEGARVFMMGDKNQLPSVECGAVFTDLLTNASLKQNIIELDESIRFSKDTKIYELATAINNGDKLPVESNSWKEPSEFQIEPDSKEKPIFYYINKDEKNEKKNISSVLEKWGDHFLKDIQESATDLDEKDLEKLNTLFDSTETCKILCAENEGNRGVKNINSFMIRHYINRKKLTSVDGFYAGELIIIKKNNKMLDLYNGDCGLLVTFKNDPTLYLMVKKSSQIVDKDEKLVDKIFKLGSFVFYPFRMISIEDIDYSYAITIHKSQGSDYKNILVILPRHKGHPLVNRQIVYTAITRTKGNTYILASQEILEEARDTLILRDTNIN